MLVDQVRALTAAVAGLRLEELGSTEVTELLPALTELRVAADRLGGFVGAVLGEVETRTGGVLIADHEPGTPGVPLHREVRHWWRDNAVVSGGQAGRDVRRARILSTLPVLQMAVVDGRLTPAQAAVLCRLVGAIPHQDLLASQQQLITAATGRNPEELAVWVRHLIATHCEPAWDDEQERARERRYLQLSDEPDGTVRGRFVLAAEDAEVVRTVLEPLARKDGDADSRSAGQRRADALVDVFAGAGRWMDLPDAGGHRPAVTFVVHADWAAGQTPPALGEVLAAQGRHPDAHPAGVFARGHGAAATAWCGPATRPTVEATLCDARISRLVLDSTGAVVALHSLSGEITTAQRKAAAARDRHCTAAGCTRPPALCEVHHLHHREHGGSTETANLALLCRRHHQAWHRGEITWHHLHLPWHQRALGDSDHDPPLLA